MPKGIDDLNLEPWSALGEGAPDSVGDAPVRSPVIDCQD